MKLMPELVQKLVQKSMKKLLPALSVLTIVFSANVVHANGLADLKTALSRYQAQTPVKALVEAKTWNRQGDGKETEETNGIASVTVDDGTRGMQVQYSKDLLNRLETEERNKEKNSKAKTPTLSALSEVNSSALRPLLYSANSLARRIDKAIFKGEKESQFNGKPARLLNFELDVEKLSERDRKYLKKFEGSLDVWIAEDGTPLASKSKQTISGRAFVVVSFDVKNEEELVYGVVGDRLIALRKENKNSGSGMGEKGESKTVKTVQIL